MTLALSLSTHWCSNTFESCSESGRAGLVSCNSVTDVLLATSALVLAILGLRGRIALSPAACYGLLGIAAGVPILDLTFLLINEPVTEMIRKKNAQATL